MKSGRMARKAACDFAAAGGLLAGWAIVVSDNSRHTKRENWPEGSRGIQSFGSAFHVKHYDE